jgi:hypothetical protein
LVESSALLPGFVEAAALPAGAALSCARTSQVLPNATASVAHIKSKNERQRAPGRVLAPGEEARREEWGGHEMHRLFIKQ